MTRDEIEKLLERAIDAAPKTAEEAKMRYQSRLCNELILNILVQLKRSSFVEDEDEAKIMLNCIGQTLIRLSMDNRSFEEYIDVVREFIIHG